MSLRQLKSAKYFNVDLHKKLDLRPLVPFVVANQLYYTADRHMKAKDFLIQRPFHNIYAHYTDFALRGLNTCLMLKAKLLNGPH